MGELTIQEQARAAKHAAPLMAEAGTAKKDAGLRAMAASLRAHEASILAANAADLAAAQVEVEAGELGAAFLDRLALSAPRLEAMAAALEEVAGLPDPVGVTVEEWLRPNGLRVGRRRIALGVIGIIYEARPNVTSDAAGLCLKAGNAVVLKGGRHAQQSNRAVVAALQAGLEEAGLPADAIQFIDRVDRESVLELLQQESTIDLIIPRGGESLIRHVAEHSRIPVIKHYKGVCHIFVDRDAELAKAAAIAVNAKVQRPTVCNAVETILLDRPTLGPALDAVGGALVAEGVRLHLDAASMAAARELPWFDPAQCLEATEADFFAEYLDLDVAIGVVDDLDGAVAHIRRYGSEHTEAIITESYTRSQAFVSRVDSAVVVVNASTRFADGGQLGLGAEIGISTTKLHAFGPMGLRELTTMKFVVFGSGQVRSA